MKRDQSSITDELLVKYLAGEVSGTEQDQVQQWMKENDANKKYFYNLKLIWTQSSVAGIKSNINTEDAWAKFKQRVAQKPSPRTIPVPVSNYKWLKIAAALLLLAGGSWLVKYMATSENNAPVAMQQVATPAEVKVNTPEPQPAESPVATTNDVQEEPAAKPVVAKTARAPKTIAVKQAPVVPALASHDPNATSRKYICNGTPCPIEICITQTIKCQNGQPAAYSTCSTLEPDQSGQLSLKMFDKMPKNCAVTVKEITITRLTTGESIVLDDNSSPATAQDLYNYITGQKKGDILAGVFHSDCDNEVSDHTLKFDNNNYGHLILQ